MKREEKTMVNSRRWKIKKGGGGRVTRVAIELQNRKELSDGSL